MKEKRSRLEQELGSGRIAPVYLLVGEERYLRQYYRDRIRGAVVPQDDTINVQVFRGEDTDPLEVIASADTVPFLAPRRLVILEDTGFFRHACDQLAAYISRIPEETVLLFSETEADRRQKLYKAVEKAGRIEECRRLKPEELKNWMAGWLKKRVMGITRDAVERLALASQGDMAAARQEMEKLCAFCMGKDGIHLADVEAVCTVPPQDELFAMIRAIASGDSRRALHLYHGLEQLQMKPLVILYNLQREFRFMLQAKDLRAQGCSLDVIAKKMGRQDWQVRGILGRAEPFSPEALRRVLAACARTEEAAKTGRMKDQIGVETLIVQISSRGR